MAPSQRVETRIAVLVLVLLCCENAFTVPVASTDINFETRGAAGKYNANHAPVISRQDQSPGHHNVVRALRGAANYTTFAALLDNMTESVIRPGITVFAPTDNALSDFQNRNAEERLQDVIRFHTITVFMPFSNLLRLDVGSTLPTEMSNLTIQVTNTTASAYQVDDAVIVYPDLYTDATAAVHGINAVFNISKITGGPTGSGGGGRSPRGRPTPPPPTRPIPFDSTQPTPSPSTNHAPIRRAFKIPILVKDVSLYQILMSAVVLCLLKLTVSVV